MIRGCSLQKHILAILQFLLMICVVLTENQKSAYARNGLTITSWNVANLHHVPGYAYRGEKGTWRTFADLEIIKQVISSQTPDIILLQEASGELAVRDVLGEGYRMIGTNEYDRRRDSILLQQRDVYPFVAVRAELDSSIITHLSIGLLNGTDPAPTRDIQYLSIKVGDRSVGLIHIHTKSSCPNTSKVGSINRSCQLNFSQFRLISQLVIKAETDDTVLVIGDFNRELLNRRLSDWRKLYAPWAKTLIAPLPCVLRKTSEPIDFAIVAKQSDDAVLTQIDAMPKEFPKLAHPERVSDHCPLTIRINFR